MPVGRQSYGCMLGWAPQGGSYAQVQKDQIELGKPLACVRIYHTPNQFGSSTYISKDVTDAVNNGKLVLSSHHAPTQHPGGWAAVANGNYDSWITSLAQAYAALNSEIIVIFNHEPTHDVNKNPQIGTLSDFANAFRHFVTIFRQVNPPNVLYGYCDVGFNITGNRGVQNAAVNPGVSYFDVLCHDVYNYYDFTGGADPSGHGWRSFQQIASPIVALAKTQKKPLIIGEVASHFTPASLSGDPSFPRDQWFSDAAAYLKSNTDAATYLIGFCYFHAMVAHDWSFVSPLIPRTAPSAYNGVNLYPPNARPGVDKDPHYHDGLSGWQSGFTNDPYFVGVPFPVALNVASGTPTNPPEYTKGSGIPSAVILGHPTVTKGGAQTVGGGSVAPPTPAPPPPQPVNGSAPPGTTFTLPPTGPPPKPGVGGVPAVYQYPVQNPAPSTPAAPLPLGTPIPPDVGGSDSKLFPETDPGLIFGNVTVISEQIPDIPTSVRLYSDALTDSVVRDLNRFTQWLSGIPGAICEFVVPTNASSMAWDGLLHRYLSTCHDNGIQAIAFAFGDYTAAQAVGFGQPMGGAPAPPVDTQLFGPPLIGGAVPASRRAGSILSLWAVEGNAAIPAVKVGITATGGEQGFPISNDTSGQGGPYANGPASLPMLFPPHNLGVYGAPPSNPPIAANNSFMSGWANISSQTPTAYSYPAQATWSYLANSNLRLARIPFKWERIQPKLSSPLNSAEVAKLTAQIGYANANGMGVILTCYNSASYYTYTAPTNGAVTGTRNYVGDGTLTEAQWQDLWTRLIAQFNSTVTAFEIAYAPRLCTQSTTPTQTHANTWQTISQNLVTSMRSNGCTVEIWIPPHLGDLTSLLKYHPVRWVTDTIDKLRYCVTHPWNKINGANILPNPSFEVNTVGWLGSTNCSIARTNAQASIGVGALAITATGTSPAYMTVAATYQGLVNNQPVTEGVTYTASADVRAATTARGVYLQFDWYQSNGTFLQTTFGASGFDSTTAWTTYTLTAAAPPTAAKLNLSIVISNQANGEVHYLDNVSLSPTAARPSWSAENYEALVGLFQSNTVPAISIPELGENLLTDGDFEQYAVGVVPTGWLVSNSTLAVVASPTFTGARSLAATASGGGATSWQSPIFAALPNETWTVAVAARAATVGVSMTATIQCYDSNQNFLSNASRDVYTDFTDHWIVRISSGVTPTSTAFVRLLFDAAGATRPNGEVHYVDTVALFRGAATNYRYPPTVSNPDTYDLRNLIAPYQTQVLPFRGR